MFRELTFGVSRLFKGVDLNLRGKLLIAGRKKRTTDKLERQYPRFLCVSVSMFLYHGGELC